VFYARSLEGGSSFSPPMLVGPLDRQASRPAVLAVRDSVHIAWKELSGEGTRLLAMTSHDDARAWSSARELARTDGRSDHPLLVSNGTRTFVSWLTRSEGYRKRGPEKYGVCYKRSPTVSLGPTKTSPWWMPALQKRPWSSNRHGLTLRSSPRQ
jgi:hypothetical protein